VTRHTEHLFLTTHKTTPSSDLLKPIIQKTFGPNHFATDHSGKTRQFNELNLVDTHFIDITHTHDKMNLTFILYSKCIIRNVITFSQWKNHLKNANFPFIMTHLPLSTMITNKPSTEYFCIILNHIPGSSSFMTHA